MARTRLISLLSPEDLKNRTIPKDSQKKEITRNDIPYPYALKTFRAFSPQTKHISSRAFAQCENLKEVSLPPQLESLGTGSFYLCSSLRTVVIPHSVSIIPAKAFHCCHGLLSVHLPNTITQVGEEAFGHCNFLRSICLPESMDPENVHQTAFHDSFMLQKFFNTHSQDGIVSALQYRFISLPIHQACYGFSGHNDITSLKEAIAMQKNLAGPTTKGKLPNLTDAIGLSALHVLCLNKSITEEAVITIREAVCVDLGAIENGTGRNCLLTFLLTQGYLSQDPYNLIFYLKDNDKAKAMKEPDEILSHLSSLNITIEHLKIAKWLDPRLHSADEETRLEPFMKAATKESGCSVHMIFHLILMDPSKLWECTHKPAENVVKRRHRCIMSGMDPKNIINGRKRHRQRPPVFGTDN